MNDMMMESSEVKDFCTPTQHKPEYPCGLRISLGPNELKKLGFMSIPEVGKEVNLICKAEVVEVRKKENDEGHHVELQIKEMEIKSEKKESTEQLIYGE